MRKLAIGLGLAASAFVMQSASVSALEGAIGSTACSLFLSYDGTNAPIYELFRAWYGGFAAARRGGAAAEPDTKTEAALREFCQAHPDATFADAAAATSKAP